MKNKVVSFNMHLHENESLVYVSVEYKWKGKFQLFMDHMEKKEFAQFVVRFHEGEIKFVNYIHNEYWEE